jgi:hypothetical protein
MITSKKQILIVLIAGIGDLILADKASICLNIVVLCRGCNASKGQLSYQLCFSDAQRDRAMSLAL